MNWSLAPAVSDMLGGWHNIRRATEQIGVDCYALGWRHGANYGPIVDGELWPQADEIAAGWIPASLRHDRPTRLDELDHRVIHGVELTLGPQRLECVYWDEPPEPDGYRMRMFAPYPAEFGPVPGLCGWRQAAAVVPMDVPVVIGLLDLGTVCTNNGRLGLTWSRPERPDATPIVPVLDVTYRHR